MLLCADGVFGARALAMADNQWGNHRGVDTSKQHRAAAACQLADASKQLPIYPHHPHYPNRPYPPIETIRIRHGAKRA